MDQTNLHPTNVHETNAGPAPVLLNCISFCFKLFAHRQPACFNNPFAEQKLCQRQSRQRPRYMHAFEKVLNHFLRPFLTTLTIVAPRDASWPPDIQSKSSSAKAKSSLENFFWKRPSWPSVLAATPEASERSAKGFHNGWFVGSRVKRMVERGEESNV